MNTREKIYDSAINLFSEYGIKNVSMRQIAKAVGIKESSIYNHYSSKSEIISNIYNEFQKNMESSRKSMTEAVNELNYMKPQDFFKSLIMDYGKSINTRIAKLVKIVIAEQFHDEKAKKLFTDEMISKPSEYFEEIINHIVKENLVDECDSHVIARLFNSAHLMLCIEFAHCSKTSQKNEVLKLMFKNVEYFIGGLEK